MRNTITICLALMALAFAACGDCDEAKPDPVTIRLATTTSTANSGLLDAILPPFEEQANIEVDVLPVGTGAALKHGMDGNVDVVLVHARSREDQFVAEGYGVDRRDVMWNDFVIAGPPSDPAGVKGMKDAAAALKKIAEAEAVFVSRGDDSGTHIRELSLWEQAGLKPAWDGYTEAGRGMGPCLTMADEKQGYVLADRGTYLAYGGKIDLVVLVEGDPGLKNPYGVMLVNPAKHAHVKAEAGTKLIDYLTSPEGRKRIGDFRKEGEVLFHPHAEE